MTQQIDEQALFKIQYGMYVVSSKLEDKLNGQIATTVMQITNDPIKVSVCLSNTTLTHEMVKQSKIFGVSVLQQDTPMTFIGKFGFKSGRDFDKFANTNYVSGITGAPLVQDNSVISLEGRVIDMLDAKTHTIFVGEVVSAKKIQEAVAMTYEYYHTVIRGKSPENAPTHIKNS